MAPCSSVCKVTVYFSGISRADDAAETATETVDADIGSSREGSRTGKNRNSFVSLNKCRQYFVLECVNMRLEHALSGTDRFYIEFTDVFELTPI
jgi:hypothetical protein